MANPEHLAIVKQGVARWNEWKGEWDERQAKAWPAISHEQRVEWTTAPEPLANFRNVDEFVDLSGAELAGRDLRGANFRATVLVGADLRYAALQGADLFVADLREALLDRSVVIEANLEFADLRRANFGRAIVAGANFQMAGMEDTVFAGVDLSSVDGLESVRHFGPSVIGIETLFKSKGKIPEVFLRGCGMPEEFIAYVGSMVGRPIEYYSCFISYSSKDQAFADRLYADLQAKGVRCWFAPHDIKGGRKIHEQLDEAIRLHDKLLLILSEHSMASDWVGTEIANAREREAREKKQMLFPITIAPFEEVRKWKLFDADRGKDSAREIREYYIPDFSVWERDNGAYQKEFDKLVAALKNSG
jgi:uncharacterized protein YjbI with pentapeptide repeats